MDRDQNKRKACAACKYQRRRCPQDCVLAPYFPVDRPLDFINVHRVFRRDYLEKRIKDTELHFRKNLMDAIKIEANARASDPSLGICRLLCQLRTLIHDAEQELYHTCRQLVFHRGRVLSTNVHGQGAAPSNLQEFMNVPPNPCGQGGHPLDLHNQFPASWTPPCDQKQNDARFSLLGPSENQPNPPFSLAESVHRHGIAPSTSLSQTVNSFFASSTQLIQNQPIVQAFSLPDSVHHGNVSERTSLSQTLSPFLASSSQPIQNQPSPQTFSLPADWVHHGNVSERIASSMNQPLNLFLASSSQPIQNQSYSLPDPVRHRNAIAPSFKPLDIASSSQPIQNQPTVQLSSSGGSERDHEDEYLSFKDFD